MALIGFDADLDFFDNDNWDKYIDIIQYTYNASTHISTSFAPSEVVFGRSITTPLGIKTIPYNKKIESYEEYIKYMDKLRKIVNIKANQKQIKYDRQRKKYYDKNKKDPELHVGDYVLYNISNQLVGNDKKLQPSWIGPYEIFEIFNNGISYKIRDLANQEIEYTVNLKLIKAYDKEFNVNVLQSPIKCLKNEMMAHSNLCNARMNFFIEREKCTANHLKKKLLVIKQQSAKETKRLCLFLYNLFKKE